MRLQLMGRNWSYGMKSLNGTAFRILAVTSLVTLLGACVAAPPPRPRVVEAPPPRTDIYAYPTNGQPPEQVDRDRYDCYQWAIQQTGFDPSSPSVPPHDRIQVVSGPPAVVPGSGVAVGAVSGAILGSIVSRPRDAGAGALVGAVLGGVLGGAAEASANQQAAQQNAVVVDRRQSAQLERKASDFRRAAGACLEARGYSVR
jgi:Glycine zipper